MEIMNKEKRQKWRQVTLDILQNKYGDEEIWALHPKLNLYFVSNKGRVRSLLMKRDLRVSKNKQGYNYVNVMLSKYKKRMYMLHRLVAETFYTFLHNSEDIFEVNHIDCNKDNNNLLNLEWTTRKENLQHARDNRLLKINQIRTTFKCDDYIVDIVKELHKKGFGLLEIKRILDIPREHLSIILKGNKLYG